MTNSLPTAIPRSTYLRLEALIVQSRQIRCELKRIRKAAHEITGERRAGLTDHAILGDDGPNAADLLRRLGIEIVDLDPALDDDPSASTDPIAAPAID